MCIRDRPIGSGLDGEKGTGRPTSGRSQPIQTRFRHGQRTNRHSGTGTPKHLSPPLKSRIAGCNLTKNRYVDPCSLGPKSEGIMKLNWTLIFGLAFLPVWIEAAPSIPGVKRLNQQRKGQVRIGDSLTRVKGQLDKLCLLYTSDAAERYAVCRSRWSPYH